MEGPGQRSTLRIASYNVRKARGLDRRRDPARIVSVICGLDAKVVVLQEADHRLGDRPAAISRKIIEAETDFLVAPVSESDVSIGWHGNAVLVDKSLSVAAVSRIVLPGLEPRGAVRLDLSNGLTLAAVHLGLLRRHRRQQLSRVADAINDARHAVIAGDFNEWRKEKGLESLTQRFEIVSPGQSYHASRPIIALDRFAHTRNLNVRNAGVVRTEPARLASDHLPVWLDLDMKAFPA